MSSGNEAPSWADQWGAGGIGDSSENRETNRKDQKNTGKKSAVSSGLSKAKAVAIVGAQKIKCGTTSGIKWIKDQYQKRSSK